MLASFHSRNHVLVLGHRAKSNKGMLNWPQNSTLNTTQAQLDPTSEESTRGIRLAAFAFVLLALAAPPSSAGSEVCPPRHFSLSHSFSSPPLLFPPPPLSLSLSLSSCLSPPSLYLSLYMYLFLFVSLACLPTHHILRRDKTSRSESADATSHRDLKSNSALLFPLFVHATP